MNGAQLRVFRMQRRHLERMTGPPALGADGWPTLVVHAEELNIVGIRASLPAQAELGRGTRTPTGTRTRDSVSYRGMGRISIARDRRH
jgi:hypothetical protein